LKTRNDAGEHYTLYVKVEIINIVMANHAGGISIIAFVVAVAAAAA
jgi:hypothetical protein